MAKSDTPTSQETLDSEVHDSVSRDPPSFPAASPRLPAPSDPLIRPDSAEESARYRETGVELGRGGIGAVRLAVDQVLGREVAMKELQPGNAGSDPADGTPVQRFLREARITSQLEHPSIVPVHDLRRRPDGTLFYTMKPIRGRSLAEAIRASRGLADRLLLLPHFVDLCQAVDYAHSRGILHRDLKPHNVMVGAFGETMLIDWGLARVSAEGGGHNGALPPGLAVDARLTLDGWALGTPSYMSPEAARGHAEQVDERSEVWSLGAVLYHLVVGRPPYMGPSAEVVLSAVLAGPPPPCREREPGLPPELGAIVGRALAYTPEDRYPSVRALLEDVLAFQSGRPVAAYAYSRIERLQRWMGQHRGLVLALGTGALALAAVLLVIVVASVIAAWRVGLERDEARAARQFAEQARGTAEQARAQSALQLTRLLMDRAERTWAESDAAAAWVYAAEALDGLENAARAVASASDLTRARGLAIAATGGWTPRFVHAWSAGRACNQLAWSPDGAMLAAACDDQLWLWRGRGEPELLPTGLSWAKSVAWSGDGRYVAVGGIAGSLRRWEAQTGTPILPHLQLGSSTTPSILVSGPDTSIWAPAEDALQQIDLATGAELRRVRDPAGCSFLAPINPGAAFAVSGASGLHLLGRGGQVQTIWGDFRPARLAWSPDASLLAVGGHAAIPDAVARVWRAGQTGEPTWELSHGSRVVDLAFRPDGALVTVGAEGDVQIWSLPEGRRVARWPVADPRSSGVGGGQPGGLALSATGDRLAVSTDKGALLLWELPRPGPDHIGPSSNGVWASWSPDGGVLTRDDRHLLVEAFDGTASPRVVAEGTALYRPTWLSGSRLVFGTSERSLVVLDTRNGERLGGREVDTWPWDLVGHGDRLASAERGEVILLEGSALRERWRSALAPQGRNVLDLAWSPDGRRVFATASQGVVAALDADSGAELGRATVATSRLHSVAVSGDGHRILAGDQEGRLHLWRVGEGSFSFSDPQMWVVGTGPLRMIATSAVSSLAATFTGDYQLRIWDLDHDRLVAELPALSTHVLNLVFSPDGSALLLSRPGQAPLTFRLDQLETSGAALRTLACQRFGLVLSEGLLSFGQPCAG